MARVTLNIEADNAVELLQELRSLAGPLSGSVRLVDTMSAAHQPKDIPPADEQPEDDNPLPHAEERTRRPRRTKAEMEAARAAEAEQGSSGSATSASTASPAATPGPSASSPPASDGSAAEPVTVEMLKEAGTAVLNKKGMPFLLGVLSPYGAKRFNEVPEDKRAEVLAKLQAAV